MATRVLETQTLLTYFEDGEGADVVQTLLEKAASKDSALIFSDVSYAELKQIIVSKHGEAGWNRVATSLDSMPVELVSTSRSIADTAASLAAQHHLALTTAFAAALAKEKKAELLAGNHDLTRLANEVKIRWINKK